MVLLGAALALHDVREKTCLQVKTEKHTSIIAVVKLSQSLA